MPGSRAALENQLGQNHAEGVSSPTEVIFGALAISGTPIQSTPVMAGRGHLQGTSPLSRHSILLAPEEQGEGSLPQRSQGSGRWLGRPPRGRGESPPDAVWVSLCRLYG